MLGMQKVHPPAQGSRMEDDVKDSLRNPGHSSVVEHRWVTGSTSSTSSKSSWVLIVVTPASYVGKRNSGSGEYRLAQAAALKGECSFPCE